MKYIIYKKKTYFFSIFSKNTILLSTLRYLFTNTYQFVIYYKIIYIIITQFVEY